MACHKLAFFLENGIGCEQNVEKAIEYYQKAYEQGRMILTGRWMIIMSC